MKARISNATVKTERCVEFSPITMNRSLELPQEDTHRGHELRASVLDCGSPLPLSDVLGPSKSARGLAQSKTSRRKGRFMGEAVRHLDFLVGSAIATRGSELGSWISSAAPAVWVLSLVLLAALGGCAVGPDYKRPAVDAPGAYRTAASDTNAPSGTNSLADLGWWEAFNDPQLTAYKIRNLIHYPIKL